MQNDLTEEETPAPRRGSELPIKDLERVRALADDLGYMLPLDLAVLAEVKSSTPEAWAKRGEGPPYVMFGNRRLYPKEGVRKFLQDRMRVRAGVASGALL